MGPGADPADNLGLADQWGDDWLTWLGTFTRNDGCPVTRRHGAGDDGRRIRAACNAAAPWTSPTRCETPPRGLALSTSPDPPVPQTRAIDATAMRHWRRAYVAGGLTESRLAVPDALEHALEAVRDALDFEHRPDHKRSWLLLSLITAVIRGIIADKVVTDPRGFRAINDEDFGDWILTPRRTSRRSRLRLGTRPVRSGVRIQRRRSGAAGVRRRPGRVPHRPGAVSVQGRDLLEDDGGMGDVVVAPVYQALHRRGVEFEFFHRLDALHLDERGSPSTP